MEEHSAFISRRRGREQQSSCCSVLPQTGRGRMVVVARCGTEDLILGPHWFMLICTFLIVIGLSVVIYGVVLNHREEASDGYVKLCSCYEIALPAPGKTNSAPMWERASFSWHTCAPQASCTDVGLAFCGICRPVSTG